MLKLKTLHAVTKPQYSQINTLKNIFFSSKYVKVLSFTFKPVFHPEWMSMEGMRLGPDSCFFHLTVRCPGQHHLSVSSLTMHTATHVMYLVSVQVWVCFWPFSLDLLVRLSVPASRSLFQMFPSGGRCFLVFFSSLLCLSYLFLQECLCYSWSSALIYIF